MSHCCKLYTKVHYQLIKFLMVNVSANRYSADVERYLFEFFFLSQPVNLIAKKKMVNLNLVKRNVLHQSYDVTSTLLCTTHYSLQKEQIFWPSDLFLTDGRFFNFAQVIFKERTANGKKGCLIWSYSHGSKLIIGSIVIAMLSITRVVLVVILTSLIK